MSGTSWMTTEFESPKEMSQKKINLFTLAMIYNSSDIVLPWK